MNDIRSSFINWYRVSGLLWNSIIVVVTISMRRRISEKAALAIQSTTPTTPITRGGRPRTSVKVNRKMALTKLIEQMAILNVFVLLSIQGRMTLAVIKAAASRMMKATAWVTPDFCANAINMPFTRT